VNKKIDYNFKNFNVGKSLGMLTQVLVLCLLVVCLLPLGSGLPIVISRNGGRSRRRRERRERYILEEKWHINTCSLALLVNPDIKLGECPNIINEYKQLYTRDSMSSLKNYYKGKCDILRVVQEPTLVGKIVGLVLGIIFLSLLSLTFITLILVFIIEIYSRAVNLVLFITRTNR
jgi:hypothetical protein